MRMLPLALLYLCATNNLYITAVDDDVLDPFLAALFNRLGHKFGRDDHVHHIDVVRAVQGEDGRGDNAGVEQAGHAS